MGINISTVASDLWPMEKLLDIAKRKRMAMEKQVWTFHAQQRGDEDDNGGEMDRIKEI